MYQLRTAVVLQVQWEKTAEIFDMLGHVFEPVIPHFSVLRVSPVGSWE